MYILKGVQSCVKHIYCKIHRVMSKYKNSQYARQESLIKSSNFFSNDKGNGRFMGKPRPFVLRDGMNNLYEPIRDESVRYFSDNKISWWGGSKPAAHTLSSQIACLNHLFSIRKDKDAVLAMLNGIRNEFKDVLQIECDNDKQYIGFEVISDHDYLNEQMLTRGSQCTSVDALIYAEHISGAKWLIPIEWKYTECYENDDKSNGDKGQVRVGRYAELTDASLQLKSLDNYFGSVYYQEPFYQLMRQTLWAENMVKHSGECLEASDYLHVHVIPHQNRDLLDKRYKVSGKGMEESWRAMLKNQSKYLIVDPATLFAPVVDRYPDLAEYLRSRYW